MNKTILFVAQALKFLSTNRNEFKLRKVIPVPVSGAFHSDLMLPAVDTFSKILDQVEMFEPLTRIYSNADGKRYKNLKQIKKQLPTQIVKPVLWEQMIQKIFCRTSGIRFPSSYTCGPKSGSLRKMVKNVHAKAAQFCVPVLED